MMIMVAPPRGGLGCRIELRIEGTRRCAKVGVPWSTNEWEARIAGSRRLGLLMMEAMMLRVVMELVARPGEDIVARMVVSGGRS